MIKELKDFLTYNKSERRGIVVLLILIFITLITNIAAPVLFPDNTKTNPELIAKADSFISATNKNTGTREYSKPATSLFQFDPNKLPAEEWKKFGLSERQIQVIMKYRNAGGRFSKKEDLKKIYSISGSMYARLEPYIMIQNTDPEIRSGDQKKHKRQDQRKTDIELNSADSGRLLKIKGIGPVFAGRIIKFRALLGGFHSKDQLLEVYGMDSSRYQNILRYITIDTGNIKRLKLNNDDFRTILRHPYISYELTKFIFKKRNEGKLKKLSSLRQFPAMSDSLYKKIIPYLSLD